MASNSLIQPVQSPSDCTETTILIIIYYTKLNWFRLVIPIHLFYTSSFSYSLCRSLHFCRVLWLGLFSFSVYDHFSSWKITLNCLVVIRKFGFFSLCRDFCMYDVCFRYFIIRSEQSSRFVIFFFRSLISPNDEHDSYFKCWFLFVKWPISEGWKFEVARWFLSHAIAFRMLMETKREPLDGTHTQARPKNVRAKQCGMAKVPEVYLNDTHKNVYRIEFLSYDSTNQNS